MSVKSDLPPASLGRLLWRFGARAWRRAAGATGLLAVCLLGFAGAPARAEGILKVLERSQQIQLEALRRTALDEDDPRSRLIHATYDEVRAQLNVDPNVPLIVVRGPVIAVCLMGKVIVANEVLADLTESERAFILAHELGHVAYNHWAQLGELYLHHIPGEVVQQHTDAIAGMLGRDASQMTHQQEYEADGFALRLLRRLGAPDDTPIVLFQKHLPMVKTTATHPGTAQRVAHLRELQ